MRLTLKQDPYYVYRQDIEDLDNIGMELGSIDTDMQGRRGWYHHLCGSLSAPTLRAIADLMEETEDGQDN